MSRYLTVFVAVTMLVGTESWGALVDSFDNTSLQPVADSSNPIRDAGTGIFSDIIGGQSDERLRWISGPGDVVHDQSSTFPGINQLRADAGTDGDLRYQYDGTENTQTLVHTGLGGVDLTDGGISNVFEAAVTLSSEPVDITIDVYTDANHWSQGKISVAAGVTMATDFFSQPFSSFTAMGASGGATFSNVGALVVLYDPQAAGFDFRIDNLSTAVVPLPGAVWMALPLLGTLGVAGAILRKRRAA